MATTADIGTTFARDYAATKTLAESFEGMMSPLSIALFEAFLAYQQSEDVRGAGIEFGVYRGRSAAILLKHLREGERAMLIDVADKYPQFDRLREVNPAFEFVKGKSEDLVDAEAVQSFLADGVRFSHHDASHTFINVSAEMTLMEPHILPRGLMVLDDFGNPSYMQVVAACFAHVAKPDCALEVFLYANNKAYLCRREDFEFYARFVLDELLPLLHAAGHDVYVTRTDNGRGYRGFSIAPKARPEDPDQYGHHIYGDRFYKL